MPSAADPRSPREAASFAFELDRPDSDVNAAFAEAADIVAGFLRDRGIEPDQRVVLAYWPV